MTVRVLQQRKAAAIAKAKGLNDRASAEDRDLTAEEQTQYDASMTEARGYDARIARAQELVAEETSSGVYIPENAHITVSENADKDERRGFKSMGDFARSVMGAKVNPSAIDKRLSFNAAAPSTFGNEGSGQDGGFLIPPQFSKEIFTLSMTDDALLPYTDAYEIESNSMVFPKDETTPWGTDGVRAYWQSEASAGTATKPKLGTSQLLLKKLMALVPLTDELISDGPALGKYLMNKGADSMRWKLNEAILNGAGNGLPLGALAGNAALTIAKDSGQATNTLSTLNLANMIARLPPGSFGKSIWLINNDVLPALFTLTLGNYPIYLPISAGAQQSPYGMLLGRPVLISQHANTFSSLGDVQLHDLSYYRSITKSGAGIETATSMHLYFDADATAFRLIFRVDGQPTIVNPINPAKGANKMSPFLQLAAR